ncbi:choice-of-anchor V domain-containing protein [Aureispira sp. CCB-E]|uniref:choice-of-anchor V domain-containing protein n=1 Tax=Aureispira sp. CCB-E TaxID=3051121 RepID=UPI0028695503|nr:choice-of-anchor V domain-containing protein [Aureispira sp. CCB-E]WMX12583.1 choice-of-anchor V domain-containing protein [Aureispira sp. CCB-E]
MKLRFIYILAFSIFATYVLQSKRLGLAAQFGIDRTGSPIANGTNCGSCHSGALNNVTLTVRVKDSGGSVVTSYIPGDTYTVEFDIASNFGFSRGFQAVALTSSNAQAGTFSNPQTNTQISTIGSRQYVEHSSPALTANNFVFIASWTAPAIGTGNVTIYSDGIVGNGNNATSGDDPAGPVSVVLTEQAAASIDYSQASYCQGSADPTPVITGTSGGSFSASPVGLSLNTTSGQIDLSASTPNTYTVTYTYATGTATDVVTVVATDDASFTYSKSSYCVNESDPTPTITGLAGGSFQASPAGLVINGSTGEIDVSASAIGSYSVGYITNGPCPTVGTFAISITSIDDATFSYANSSYCQNQNDPTPTAVTSGGSYSSTLGLAINSNTGQIDLSASTAGTYTVTYTTTGSCSNNSTQAITINAADNAGFSYSSSSYCQNGSDPTPAITGLSGGSFSSTSGLSINSNTGQIDLSASTVGTYTVTYTTSGTCPNSTTQAVTVNALDNAGFSYSSSSYCQNGSDPTPTITGLGGGSFSSTSGLSINSNTGQIDLSASTAGTYTVTYTTSGICPNTATQSVVVNATDNAGFNYSSPSYCQNANDPTPTITGLGGGSFSSTSGLSINSNTGQIDLSASTAGTYVVTYATSGTCPNSTTQTVVINALDNPTFAYSSSAYCKNNNDPTPTIAGAGGGTFSSTTGLSINSSTGQIDLSASTAGTYTIMYTTAGPCPTSSTDLITINNVDNANFSYSNTAYCQNANDPTPTITGSGGGTFSSTSGLSINNNTGQIDLSASVAGTYTVIYTTSGPCPNSSNVAVTITALDNAGFNYSSSSYCQNGSDPTPTITGLTGGTFSSASGLAININTGTIDVSASTAGTYTIFYSTQGTCPNNSTQTVTITPTDNSSFSYSSVSYCQNGSDPSPSIAGTTGGTFTSTAGLAINATSGQIDVSASNTGTYNVTYTTNGSCPSTTTVTVTITAADNASFTYGGNTFCQNGTDPTPTGSLAGGVWSATAGLVINSGTGTIDLSASTAGTYNVTYTTNGPCPNSNSATITITATDNASFSYNATSACQNGTDLTATVTGLAGGAFTSTTGLSINGNTGQIDVSASTVGTYVVTYTTNGSCPNTATATITIDAADDASFTYGGATFCQNAVDPTPTVNLAGGTFSSTTGLSINGNTGQIDVSASTAGSYVVTYTTNGTCPSSSTQNITITTTGNSSFNYSSTSYCLNGNNPTPTITGNPGGSFSSTSGLAIDGTTGTIDLANTTAGTYTVTYSVTGSCPSSSTASVTILTIDDASFSYSAASACQNGTDLVATVTGLAGGTFTSTTGLAINSNSGLIDVSASTAGSYTVTYTTNGTCPNTSTSSVVIMATDNASFTYGGNTFCQNGIDPTPTGGLSGGVWSAGGGLVINSSTGTIDVSSATAGTYNVTYTTNGPCPNSNTIFITITDADDASFSYNAVSACQNGSNLVATITGLSGGTFTSTTGLSIDGTTGEIDVAASTAGTYNVTYTTNGPCPNSALVSITIEATDDASFTYGGATFCQNAADPIPTVNLSGGTFTVLPAGLMVNSATGEIDVSASAVGTYDLTYTTNGPCPSSSTLSVTITATGDASFNYSTANYCQNATNPIPTITGNPGGTFTSTTGLILNGTTGEIDLAASTVGTYTVTYAVTGSCPSSSSNAVTILAADVATFGYTDTTICLNIGVNPIISVTGVSAGTYTASSSGLVFANTTTGEIDLAASVAGNYVVTYTSNGNCPAIETVNVDLSICGGTQTLVLEDAYALFPNPNIGRFTIENKGTSGDVILRVRDVYGKVIYMQEAYWDKKEQYTIDVPNIVGGMYWVEIQKGMSSKVLKMIVAE